MRHLLGAPGRPGRQQPDATVLGVALVGGGSDVHAARAVAHEGQTELAEALGLLVVDACRGGDEGLAVRLRGGEPRGLRCAAVAAHEERCGERCRERVVARTEARLGELGPRAVEVSDDDTVVRARWSAVGL